MGLCTFLFQTFIVIEFTWQDGGILTLNFRTFVIEICFTIQDGIFYWLGIFGIMLELIFGLIFYPSDIC